MDDNILELRNINKYYSGVHAVKNVSLDIKEGEIHAIVGENGAGKSTITKIIAGVETKDSGEIFLKGKPLKDYTVSEAQKMGICRVPQELEMIDNLNVAENICLSNIPVHKVGMIDKKKMHDSTKKIMKQLKIELDTKKKVRDLIIGQQQLVAITKALAMEPRIIIFDEPTSSLSENEINILMKEIRILKSKGITILYITHKLEEVKEISDRITIMRDGNKIVTVNAKDVQIKEIIKYMIGRDLSELYPKEDIEKGEIILTAKNIVSYMVKNNSFNLYKGEILGMYGLVGSGRTEMVRALFGANKKDSGEVILNGKVLDIKHPTDAVANGLALVPEDRRIQGMIADTNVKENLTLANLKKLSKWIFVDNKKEKTKVTQLIKSLNIQPPYIDTEVKHLSGGNQQKVVIGKWLCRQSRVFIFDEPTKGIDVGSKVEIYKLMESQAKSGNGIIFISSEMPELMGICDRILVFKDGSIKSSIMRNEFSEEKILSVAISGGE